MDILVLGAGLQGTGVALELACRGLPVTLIDQDPRALNRASLRNEGKIHLGFIYANDPSRSTAFLQLEGALRFRSSVSRWIGDSADWLSLSAPFHYLVANDSVVDRDSLAAHYASVEERCRRRLELDASLDYLGARPEELVRALTTAEIAAHFDPGRFAGGFATVECAIDTERLASALRHAVAKSRNITFRASHVVRSIAPESVGFRLDGDGPDGAWCIRAGQVVNATWERRLAIDQQLGIAPPRDLLHRLKFRLIARLPEEFRSAPSVSMVLGRFGDIVVRRDGTAYLSWYPSGLRGWSAEAEPPRSWDAACRGEVEPEFAREITASILSGIERWFPGIARCEALVVDAGAIVAIGRSDVDDVASSLHDRSRIGVTWHGGYHSIDTGKLTTAPMFAVEAADRVQAFQGSRSGIV